MRKSFVVLVVRQKSNSMRNQRQAVSFVQRAFPQQLKLEVHTWLYRAQQRVKRLKQRAREFVVDHLTISMNQNQKTQWTGQKELQVNQKRET